MHRFADARVAGNTSSIQPTHRTHQRILQREQIGRVYPASGNIGSHFVYKLDSQRWTFSHLASYYGVTPGAIQAMNPGASPERLQEGQAIRVPATNPPGTPPILAYVRLRSGKMVNIENNDIPARWSQAGNLAGRLARGTAVVAHDSSRVWLPISELHNRADGIIAEMKLRGAALGSTYIFAHVPEDNIRMSDRQPSDLEVNQLARMIWGEQRSQGDAAMTCAAWVARNRYDAGWGQSYTDIITIGQFQGLVPPSQVQNLTGSELTTWDRAKEIATGVINNTISDPTGSDGLYFGNGQSILTQMQACATKNSEFVYGTVAGTTLHWSNGDYTARNCTIP